MNVWGTYINLRSESLCNLGPLNLLSGSNKTILWRPLFVSQDNSLKQLSGLETVLLADGIALLEDNVLDGGVCTESLQVTGRVDTLSREETAEMGLVWNDNGHGLLSFLCGVYT